MRCEPAVTPTAVPHCRVVHRRRRRARDHDRRARDRADLTRSACSAGISRRTQSGSWGPTRRARRRSSSLRARARPPARAASPRRIPLREQAAASRKSATELAFATVSRAPMSARGSAPSTSRLDHERVDVDVFQLRIDGRHLDARVAEKRPSAGAHLERARDRARLCWNRARPGASATAFPTIVTFAHPARRMFGSSARRRGDPLRCRRGPAG